MTTDMPMPDLVGAASICRRFLCLFFSIASVERFEFIDFDLFSVC